MSEPQLISPLLDGFVMGDPIQSHDGVRACPAMHLETDEKYIVKIVSLPASQSKIDALLLAGAFSSRENVAAYFQDLADGVLEEAELLRKLSRNEGFASFENWQMVPMEDGETGFDIYLLGKYRPTLDGAIRGRELTHLQGVNLGLDLCAALSIARRFGYMYCNLRPTNIYICDGREFRIGDLGFLSLTSLPYASLPDKYHSDYTAPEILDAYSALNDTLDIYAAGLVLYQVFNNGKLPPVGMPLEPPCYADKALSEIILKACALHPEERWQDPVQMGQALVNYLQSHSVNDVPIIPPAPESESEPPEIFPDEDDQPATEDVLAEVDQALEAAPPIPAAPTEDAPAAEEESPESAESEIPVSEELSGEDEEVAPEEAADIPTEECAEEPPAETGEQPEECDEGTAADFPAQDEESSDETAQMLAQADDLIAHHLPEPPVAPEPIEVTLPAPTVIPEEVTEEVTAQEEPAREQAEESTQPQEGTDEEPPEEIVEKTKEKKKHKGLITVAVILSIVLILGAAVYLFYQHFYVQTITDMFLSGSEDRLSVRLVSDIPDEKLTVRCTDTHGNSLTASVRAGVADFTGLKPGTAYKLEVRIDGFHKLMGKTSESYTTAAQTVINGFYAATGPEDGSVILSFTTQGPDSMQWSVSYWEEGSQEATSNVFTGHMVTLTGLTVGKEYTFTLEPVTQLYVTGTDTITHTASKIVYAKNVQILGFVNKQLQVVWDSPEDTTVSQWYVRCYNDAGYDKTLNTNENTIYFDDLDMTVNYTIEVTAEGMTLGERTYLTANSVTVSDVQADGSNRNSLNVTWKYEGTAPEGGWLLLYTVNGSTEQQVVKCAETSGTITPLIPGAQYSITVKSADGVSTFGGTLTYEAPKAASFSGYLVKAENIEFSMCKTPDNADWDRYDVPKKDYTTSFNVGVSASFVMHLTQKTQDSDESIVSLFVIRDESGKIVSSKYESRTWSEMWYRNYGKLTIPVMPETPGSYTVDIYFNGTAVTTQSFKVLA